MKRLSYLNVPLFLLLASNAVAQCELPAGFSNSAVVTEGDLEVTFATDRLTYAPGDIVSFCLIVHNLGTSVFSINWGIDPQDGIFVMPDTCTAVDQGRCFGGNVFHHPGIVYFYSAGTTLGPGECRAWERTWDTGIQSAEYGTYNVLGGMFEACFCQTVGTFHVLTGGVLLRRIIEGSVSAGESTWGKIKALYE
ncbi:MAG: hypothetical protein QME66_08755 [Candidatus Eisenbacteria bacterium]|nr:hypothetical protein [Candidatus Eisenbacteria bacterium]